MSATTPAEALRDGGMEALFHGHPDGVCLVDLDGAFVESNEALARLSGYSVEELGRMTFERLLHPDAVEGTWAGFRRATGGENARYITRIVTPEGATRVLDATNIPLRGREGEVVAVLAIVRDIGDVERAAAEAAGNEALMRMAARIARFAGWVVDVPTRRIVLSDGLHELLGIERGAVPHDGDAVALFEPADRPAIMNAFHAAMVLGEPLDAHGTLHDADGRRMHVHLVGEPERDETGRIVRLHGAFHDVTPLVRHREEQRAMARFLRNGLDQVHEAIAFVDREWRFTFANTLAVQYAGVSEAQLQQLSLWEAFPTAVGTDFERIYRDAMERGVPGTARGFVTGWERWFEVSANPIDDGIAVIVRDVSDDQRSREILAEYTARVEAQARLLDAARDAIIVRDLAGHVTYWNRGAERIYGRAAHEVLGRQIGEVLSVPPDDYARMDAALFRDGYWTGEIRQRRADGTPMLAESRLQVVRGDDGEPTAVFGVHSDVTDQKRLDNERARAQRLESLGTLAGGIAHDLNNVLTPILMTVQLLAADETDERRRELLAAMDAAAHRGAAMIRKVLSFARGSGGKRGRVDAGRLLRELQALGRETLPRTIELEVVVPEDPPAVLADETELFQVLVNLATNARDAMPDGGRLTIRADPVADGLRFEVSDTGCGVDDATRAAMFEPFFTTKESGTGLGLPTSAAIVKAHGGDLEVRSRPGEGTAISFVLPAAPADAVVEAPEPHPVEPQPGAGRSVLVVDDEATIRDLVAHTLRQAGYRVATAEGAEALGLLADPAQHVDVVVTDVMMPEVSGDGLARLVAAGRPGAAVVLMSGMDPGPGARAAVEAGAALFLPKPFTPSMLLAAVDRALAQSVTGPQAVVAQDLDVQDVEAEAAPVAAAAVLIDVVAPVLRRAIVALEAPVADDVAIAALAAELAATAEEAQRRLGAAARDPRIHGIVGAAASAAMALALAEAGVPREDVTARLREGLADLAAFAAAPAD
ncbi:PAS domain S-box protein [Leifsonia sp. F6_8S_P_1B]|uniref:histidine kinase n=1 Tax=Leifsonia williamsii TaxID=3035919 RepID=A0ABT8K759_9MICO|nr:PAS domain S-box protein [Leifsonia williamsii]MDN4613285.1 PAS domain S-box protein [Leifsonia williamsii]